MCISHASTRPHSAVVGVRVFKRPASFGKGLVEAFDLVAQPGDDVVGAGPVRLVFFEVEAPLLERVFLVDLAGSSATDRAFAARLCMTANTPPMPDRAATMMADGGAAAGRAPVGVDDRPLHRRAAGVDA